MPTLLPNGNYAVVVSPNNNLSGALNVTSNTAPLAATYKGQDVSSSFNPTSGSIGWQYTPSAPNSKTSTFSNGTYNNPLPPPPNNHLITGGLVNTPSVAGIEDSWAADAGSGQGEDMPYKKTTA